MLIKQFNNSTDMYIGKRKFAFSSKFFEIKITIAAVRLYNIYSYLKFLSQKKGIANV